VNPKRFLIELKRRNISESRDRKRASDADQHRTQDSNLHIVHQHRESLGIAHVFERLRYASPKMFFISTLKGVLTLRRVFIDQRLEPRIFAQRVPDGVELETGNGGSVWNNEQMIK
jgi:hypothetical protein